MSREERSAKCPTQCECRMRRRPHTPADHVQAYPFRYLCRRAVMRVRIGGFLGVGWDGCEIRLSVLRDCARVSP